MDGQRFDQMARWVERAVTRRSALAGMLGLAAAGLTVTGAEAAARLTCRPVAASCLRNAQCCSGLCDTRRTTPRNRRNRCVCPDGTVRCGTTCADLMTDDNNCGACGHVCAGTCVSGICTCQGISCTIDEAGGWEQCGIDFETCTPRDSCTYEGNLSMRSCTSHADCADYAPECGVDGVECGCVAGFGGETAGDYNDFGGGNCAVFVPQPVPGLCDLSCEPSGSGMDNCFITTSGAVIMACNSNASPNNATDNYLGQQPSEQTIGCQSDADCADNCPDIADACHCTVGGVEEGATFALWSDKYGVERACIGLENVSCE
jgi:hypothetical protein